MEALTNMLLYIDTSDSEKINLELDGKIFETLSKKRKSQRLLPFIYEILKKKKKKITDLTEIKVNTGPGSFTGLRIGVAVASAIGWALGIKVNGRDIRKGKTIDVTY